MLELIPRLASTFLFNHLRIAHFATLLFSHSCVQWGGVHPGASIFPTPTRREAEESRPSASYLRYFLTSLLPYFLLPLQSLRFHPGMKCDSARVSPKYYPATVAPSGSPTSRRSSPASRFPPLRL